MKKVLLIQTASLGDVILATATAHSVRTLYPDARISFLVKDSCADLLKNNPVIDNLIVWNKTQHKYRNLCSLLKQIRREKFDAVINFQRFFSSGFITAFSKAGIRAGFSNNPMSLLFNRKVKHQLNGLHETERNLALAKMCFPDLESAKPVIAVSAPADVQILSFSEQKFITIFPGSLWPTKQFPKESWIKFLKKIPADLKVIIAGSMADRTQGDDILAARPENTINLCGKMSILESAWLIKNASMNFTNDSAPTHIASAVNAPVATVFCSTVPGFGFTPLSEKSHIIEYPGKLPCRPCGIHGHRTCPEKHFDCGHKIEISQLTELI